MQVQTLFASVGVTLCVLFGLLPKLQLFFFMWVFTDFEKKDKKETCPVLEQFLCEVAKTGQPM